MSSSQQASSTKQQEDPHAADPLPPGWTRQYSKSNAKYFYHHRGSNVTQWHFPTASEAKDPLVAKQRAQEAAAREGQKRTSTQQSPKADNTSSSSNNSNNKRPRHSDNDSTKAAANNKKKETPTTTNTKTNDIDLDLADKTSVAIIVPYRDLHSAQQRAAHLAKFIPHMIQFLNTAIQQQLISDFFIYIMEQSNDGYKFNRGKLLNIGFDMARKSHVSQSSGGTTIRRHTKTPHDVYIFHDVDLLPGLDLLRWYTQFPQTPIHIARVWNRYSNNPKYFGGIVSFSSSDYKRINGYPNNFFGWGGEDDEMQRRLERLGIQFVSPDRGTITDLEDMSIGEKIDFLRQHKEWKCMVKWELQEEHERTWKTNGLSDLKYTLLQTTPLDETNRAAKFTVEVKLNGNHWTNDKAGMDYVETNWKK